MFTQVFTQVNDLDQNTHANFAVSKILCEIIINKLVFCQALLMNRANNCMKLQFQFLMFIFSSQWKCEKVSKACQLAFHIILLAMFWFVHFFRWVVVLSFHFLCTCAPLFKNNILETTDLRGDDESSQNKLKKNKVRININFKFLH